MDTYGTLNEILVRLFRDVANMQQRVITSHEFKDITSNDVQVIKTIGVGAAKNMSAIAKELSVTVGTLTIAMNSLVKKGYVIRQRGEDDRRVVYISLSEKGRVAYEYHAKIHKAMIESMIKDLSQEQMDLLINTLNHLELWIKNWQED